MQRFSIFACVALLILTRADFTAAEQSSNGSPQIPIGLNAIRQWERWPYLRIGVRCYMRSTFDRTGGNDNADAAHFIRQLDDTHNVALDDVNGEPANQHLVVGQVIGVHLDEAVIEDGRVLTAKLQPVARCGYREEYTVVRELFAMWRPT